MNEKLQKNLELMVDTLQKGAVQPAELAQVVKALLGVVRTVRSQLEDYVKEVGKVIKIDVESLAKTISDLETKTDNAIGEVSNKSQKFSLSEVSKIAQRLQKEMDK